MLQTVGYSLEIPRKEKSADGEKCTQLNGNTAYITI